MVCVLKREHLFFSCLCVWKDGGRSDLGFKCLSMHASGVGTDRDKVF